MFSNNKAMIFILIVGVIAISIAIYIDIQTRSVSEYDVFRNSTEYNHIPIGSDALLIHSDRRLGGDTKHQIMKTIKGAGLLIKSPPTSNPLEMNEWFVFYHGGTILIVLYPERSFTMTSNTKAACIAAANEISKKVNREVIVQINGSSYKSMGLTIDDIKNK